MDENHVSYPLDDGAVRFLYQNPLCNAIRNPGQDPLALGGYRVYWRGYYIIRPTSYEVTLSYGQNSKSRINEAARSLS